MSMCFSISTLDVSAQSRKIPTKHVCSDDCGWCGEGDREITSPDKKPTDPDKGPSYYPYKLLPVHVHIGPDARRYRDEEKKYKINIYCPTCDYCTEKLSLVNKDPFGQLAHYNKLDGFPD